MTTLRQIAREVGVHPSTVMRRVRRGDDPAIAKHASAGASYPEREVVRPINPDLLAILERGLSDGSKTIEIAEDLGVSRATVYRMAVKAGLQAKRGKICYAETVRRAISDMTQGEAVDYLLEIIEQLIGQSDPIERDVCGVRLTAQQAIIFSMLNRNLNETVALDRLLTAINAGKHDARATGNGVHVQICKIRRLLRDHYRIDTIWGLGFRMERIE